MYSNTGTTETARRTDDCFTCGDTLAPAPAGSTTPLCPTCEKTADLPMSAYYLTQYYYRFAD